MGILTPIVLIAAILTTFATMFLSGPIIGLRNRHAAALALVGWYLMLPTSLSHPTPLSSWHQIQSFDTAADCETFKQKEILSILNHEIPGMEPKMEKANASLYATGLCIETDDPRLK